MKVNLKFILVAFLVVIIFGSIALAIFELNGKGKFRIEIINSTAETIDNLKISHELNAKDIIISNLPPKADFKLVFNPKEKFQENTMWLSYQDKNGEAHKEAIFGYFEKGYGGKALIKIVRVEPDGIIKFEIKTHIKI